METGKIIKVAGPVVEAEGLRGAKMYDVVKVSNQKLIGEIIELAKDLVTIQVYEETSGIGPGEPVFSTGMPLSVELGPGLIKSIYDGIQRPLDLIRLSKGDFISRGAEEDAINRKKKWDFEPVLKKGDKVISGDIIGTVQESSIIQHKIMIPYGIQGEIEEIYKGKFTVTETITKIRDRQGLLQEIKMLQKWPVRKLRPYKEKLPPFEPLITGQRVIDTFFPIAKGGTACIPGPFGSGKTVIQHQLSKWCNAEIIIFIGCGERGNEMTDVLLEFPELIDPHTGKRLMERTILIANTSNMPVAAREASVYTGITIAEYYRDMGYNVALMADSTSRWAEAMREISGRLEEMPGEEGYPAYLGTRISSFYERSGRVKCLSNDDREATLSVIGAVSPPGGDLSEPVTQNTLRTVQVFWSLQDKLAYERHFPAIDWLTSYSLYLSQLSEFYEKEINKDFIELRNKSMGILQQEAELEEIVRLVGVDALSTHERLILETARSIREDFLHQDAFDEIDTYTSVKKQFLMLKLIILFHETAEKVIVQGVNIEKINSLPVKSNIIRAKYIKENNLKKFSEIEKEIICQINSTTT
ncbi:MAG: V-type ATP synthase subunit A [Candidatus Infernicultor aquiphilus]|uniref:V-type ATP synthase alpha chain n=1 Tax=Candidatus Infernicultor aquiphilus TaxID=1805029 RepID=A0A1J5GQB7_9BACT|nr:V-type ATP synthase subunit A [bacterium]OIP75061.1 MAG: V-type ATP synthase subunit A [Candidatus Atribacteria bacterium CG2_30_33_13]PIU25187.1 MAG: V-type ATP synthase subunit A [Candidatus Atribacteria bacterium CG08_land_8_20_14_0_20_33_29]PIW12197.1 MAG: V-type ATP synthase subunit A [Candidatus Atribacteria bacterium CG17_big_fil_post_rev_8_21_14_2_50_34_11]PIX33806.1 MAG: V-type ATP synthase subunit A [Candidatus Atribacteria bacterium CG_4_8_14_3_um_filter_34_18]PIY31460.1 MAG: V-t